MKSKTILKFIKREDGIGVIADGGTTVDILMGIAETIKLLAKNTDETEKSVMEDIDKILNLLNKDIDERIKNVGYGRNFDDLIKESEEKQ